MDCTVSCGGNTKALDLCGMAKYCKLSQTDETRVRYERMNKNVIVNVY